VDLDIPGDKGKEVGSVSLNRFERRVLKAVLPAWSHAPRRSSSPKQIIEHLLEENLIQRTWEVLNRLFHSFPFKCSPTRIPRKKEGVNFFAERAKVPAR
jgi:hypothetical protein